MWITFEPPHGVKFPKDFCIFMEKNDKKNQETWSTISLAWQLGYSIAIPLIALALLGRFLDKKFETSPWLLLVGIFLSLITSTFLVYSKTIKILGQEAGDNDKKEENQKI